MTDFETVMVTGGAGFIGGAVVRHLMRTTTVRVVNVDKLSYAGSVEGVADVAGDARYTFERIDLCDGERLRACFRHHRPTAILHLAAETHVDRSITGPWPFIESNIVGTYTLLEVARAYWSELDREAGRRFRLLHVSTDEVFGSLGPSGKFSETTPYSPNSPYSASKASADHLVRAWAHTFGLPVLITNCSNNYGPWQFPEKLIPVLILSALAGRPLPIYGTGDNVRDWLFVEDHAEALWRIVNEGDCGETYTIGGGTERTNLELAHTVCSLLDAAVPRSDGGRYADLITFVTDRPGHDKRYAIDDSKLRTALGWAPRQDLASGLAVTVRWYIDHQDWCRRVIAAAERRAEAPVAAVAGS